VTDYSYFDAHGECRLARQNGREDPAPADMTEVEGYYPRHWMVDGVPTPPKEWVLNASGRVLSGLPPNARLTVGITEHLATGPEYTVTGDPFVTVEVVAPGYERKRVYIP